MEVQDLAMYESTNDCDTDKGMAKTVEQWLRQCVQMTFQLWLRWYIEDLVQDWRNSSALVIELLHSCAKPLT